MSLSLSNQKKKKSMLNSYEVNCNSHDGIKYHFQLSILSQTLSPRSLSKYYNISSLDTYTHTVLCVFYLSRCKRRRRNKNKKPSNSEKIFKIYIFFFKEILLHTVSEMCVLNIRKIFIRNFLHQAHRER